MIIMHYAKYKLVQAHDVLLEYIDNFGYVPAYYEYKKGDNGKYIGKRVSDNAMLTCWLTFLKRENSQLNVHGEMECRNLYYEQHSLAILILLDIMNCNSSKWLLAVARQWGKSELARLIVQFCFIFMPMFSIKSFKMYKIVMTSYDATVTEKIFKPIRDGIENTIELFNEIFPSMNLLYNKTSKNFHLDNNTTHLEIGRVVDGKLIKYSEIYALGFESKNGRDSLTANLLLIDEHTKMEMFGEGKFAQSFMPMTSSTGGVLMAIGISTNDSSSVGYNLYHSSKVKKYVSNWENVIKNKYCNKIDDAEMYKKDAETNREIWGENSTEWITNYEMSFDSVNGKFITPKLVEDNNLMRTIWERSDYTNPSKFIVGGLDLSCSYDRTVLFSGEAYDSADISGRFIFEGKDIIIYNINRDSIDIESLVRITVDACISRKLDILLVDGGGTQKAMVNMIMNEAHKCECKTQIVPYDFSNEKKAEMFLYLERSLYSQKCLLPHKDYLETHKEVRLLYDELISLKKEEPKRSGGNIQYKAPSGKTDDIMCALAMANYAVIFIKRCEEERKMITVGRYTFIPRLIKSIWEKVQKELACTNYLYIGGGRR